MRSQVWKSPCRDWSFPTVSTELRVSTSVVTVSDGHHAERRIRTDRVEHRWLFRPKRQREKGSDSCAGRSSEAKGDQRRRRPLHLWQMSGSSAARLPGRLLPCQHQSAGVRHDGLHGMETRPRSQGGSSEVSHRVSEQRRWVHVQPNVPNQARATSLGEKRPTNLQIYLILF